MGADLGKNEFRNRAADEWGWKTDTTKKSLVGLCVGGPMAGMTLRHSSAEIAVMRAPQFDDKAVYYTEAPADAPVEIETFTYRFEELEFKPRYGTRGLTQHRGIWYPADESLLWAVNRLTEAYVAQQRS